MHTYVFVAVSPLSLLTRLSLSYTLSLTHTHTHTRRYAVRSFAERGMEMVVCCSFAKNFGLYGERTGCVHVVVSTPADKSGVASQLRAISRVIYSTCPTFGARIVSTILNSPTLRTMWLADCKAMADRIALVRQAVFTRLTDLNVKGTWEHVMKQRGMFTFTGINKDAVLKLQVCVSVCVCVCFSFSVCLSCPH